MTARGWRGPTEERLELAERVRQLREGTDLTYDEIGDRLGISRSYASELSRDPDGARARARKDGYSQKCVDCGDPTSGSNGVAQAPIRCARCAKAKQHDDRKWTAEAIVAAFQEFHARYRRPPTTTDVMGVSPSQAARLSPDRVSEAESTRAAGILPSPPTVSEVFGSWTDALRAAGLDPAPTGGAGHRSARFGPRQQQVFDLLADGEAWDVATIAAVLDISAVSARSAARALANAGAVERVEPNLYRTAVNAPTRKRSSMARIYLVLRLDGDRWEPVGGDVEANSGPLAVEQVADAEGTYVAVRRGDWLQMEVRPVTRLAAVASAPYPPVS